MAAREAGDGETCGKPENDRAGVTFQIAMEGDVEELDRPRSAPPKRLKSYQRKTVTKEELEQKQLEAEKRRKEREREMLLRVQQSREEVEKLNSNFNALLEQDAKRQGAAGTDDIPTMTPQQLRVKFHTIRQDYSKMVSAISHTVHLPQ